MRFDDSKRQALVLAFSLYGARGRNFPQPKYVDQKPIMEPRPRIHPGMGGTKQAFDAVESSLARNAQ